MAAINYQETIPQIAQNIKFCVTPESTIEWIKQQLEYAYQFGYADGFEEQLTKREEDMADMEKLIVGFNREAAIM